MFEACHCHCHGRGAPNFPEATRWSLELYTYCGTQTSTVENLQPDGRYHDLVIMKQTIVIFQRDNG